MNTVQNYISQVNHCLHLVNTKEFKRYSAHDKFDRHKIYKVHQLSSNKGYVKFIQYCKIRRSYISNAISIKQVISYNIDLKQFFRDEINVKPHRFNISKSHISHITELTNKELKTYKKITKWKKKQNKQKKYS